MPAASGSGSNWWSARTQGLSERMSRLSNSWGAPFSAPAARSQTGLPGPSRSSSLSRQQQSQVGVARWPDSRYNNEDSPAQRSYGQSFYKASREIGSQISEGKISSFSEVWTQARNWRSNATGNESSKFNEGRNSASSDPHITPLTDQYSYIKSRYFSASGGSVEPTADPSRFRLAAHWDLPDTRRFQIEDEIDGQSVKLTSIMMSTDPAADRAAAQQVMLRSHFQTKLGEPHHIEHTPASEVPRIMSHAETLYKSAIDPSVSNDKALSTMGELHWWVTHAMPDERGSAAKAELSIRSIAQSRGMDLPPFSKGFVPDLEAMTTSRSEFTSKYPASFDWKSTSWRSMQSSNQA